LRFLSGKLTPNRRSLPGAEGTRSAASLPDDGLHAPGIEIGRPGEAYRRVRIDSAFGKVAVLVTDGHLPWPYGRELDGYEVSSVQDTLARATAAGANILAAP